MLWIIILTSLTVSIDSFVCGLSLSLSGIKKRYVIIGIALTVLIMCLLASIFGTALTKILSEQVTSLGGLILIAIGIFNLIKKDKEQKNNKTAVKEIIATGIAVGLDGALATLSLSMMGMNYLYIPFIIAFFHALLIGLGTILSGKATNSGFLGGLAPLILIGLGLYKIITAFI